MSDRRVEAGDQRKGDGEQSDIEDFQASAPLRYIELYITTRAPSPWPIWSELAPPAGPVMRLEAGRVTAQGAPAGLAPSAPA